MYFPLFCYDYKKHVKGTPFLMLGFIMQLGGFFIRLNFLYGPVSNELVEQLQEGGTVYGQIILPENFMLHILDVVAGTLGGVGPLIHS